MVWPYNFPTDRVTGGPAPADDVNALGAALNEADSEETPSVLVARDSNGRFRAEDPADAQDVATRGWVVTQNGFLIPKSLVDAKGDLLVGTADDTVARLPVGTDGQVLTADSSEPTGQKWADLAAGGGGHWFRDITPVYAQASGNWNPGKGHNGGSGGAALNNGTAFAVPFVMGDELEVDAIGINVTTAAAGSTVRLALFATGASGWLPGDLIQDFGTTSGATTGHKALTFSALTLDPYTLYWVAFESAVAVPQLAKIDGNWQRFPFNTSQPEQMQMGGRYIHTWARSAGAFPSSWGGGAGGAGSVYDFAWRKA